MSIDGGRGGGPDDPGGPGKDQEPNKPKALEFLRDSDEKWFEEQGQYLLRDREKALDKAAERSEEESNVYDLISSEAEEEALIEEYNLAQEQRIEAFVEDLQQRVKSDFYKEHRDFIPNVESLAENTWDMLSEYDTVVFDQANKPVGDVMGGLVDLARGAEGLPASRKVTLPLINPNTIVKQGAIPSPEINESRVLVVAGQASVPLLDAFCQQVREVRNVEADWACLNPMGGDDENGEDETVYTPDYSEPTLVEDLEEESAPQSPVLSFQSSHPTSDQVNYLHYSRETDRLERRDADLVAHRIYAFLNETER